MHTSLAHAQPFSTVHDLVRERAERNLPDALLRVSDLRLTPKGHLAAPGLPELTLNTWSKKQLSTSLGIRWDKWFGSMVSGEECAEEANRRLSRLPGEVKLRATRAANAATGVVLRALLSPGFTPIDDARLFAHLAETFGSALDAYRFTRVDLTDSTELYVAVHVEARKVGDDELHPGWALRNSEVGASALTVDDSWLRLVCMNGLLMSVGGKRALYRTHRKIDDDQLTAALAVAMKNLPTRWTAALSLMEHARLTPVPHPDAAVAVVLEAVTVPRALVTEAQTVALKDGATTRYDVVQAITYVAHAKNTDPELRFSMERAAGDYLVATEVPANTNAIAPLRAVS